MAQYLQLTPIRHNSAVADGRPDAAARKAKPTGSAGDHRREWEGPPQSHSCGTRAGPFKLRVAVSDPFTVLSAVWRPRTCTAWQIDRWRKERIGGVGSVRDRVDRMGSICL